MFVAAGLFLFQSEMSIPTRPEPVPCETSERDPASDRQAAVVPGRDQRTSAAITVDDRAH